MLPGRQGRSAPRSARSSCTRASCWSTTLRAPARRRRSASSTLVAAVVLGAAVRRPGVRLARSTSTPTRAHPVLHVLEHLPRAPLRRRCRRHPRPRRLTPRRQARAARVPASILVVIASIVVLAVGAITWSRYRDDDGTDTVRRGLRGVSEPGVAEVGDVAPDFELETLDGGTVRLSDFRGTPVVLNFWASWCTPCREEFPCLRDALADADGAFELIGVDTGDIRGDGRAVREGATRRLAERLRRGWFRCQGLRRRAVSRRPSSSAATAPSRRTRACRGHRRAGRRAAAHDHGTVESLVPAEPARRRRGVRRSPTRRARRARRSRRSPARRALPRSVSDSAAAGSSRGERLQRVGQAIQRVRHAAEEEQHEEEPVRDREVCLGAQRPCEEHADPRERDGAEEEQAERRDDAAGRLPPERDAGARRSRCSAPPRARARLPSSTSSSPARESGVDPSRFSTP